MTVFLVVSSQSQLGDSDEETRQCLKSRNNYTFTILCSDLYCTKSITIVCCIYESFYLRVLLLSSMQSIQMYRLNGNSLSDPEVGKALTVAIAKMTSLQNLEWVLQHHSSCWQIIKMRPPVFYTVDMCSTYSCC